MTKEFASLCEIHQNVLRGIGDLGWQEPMPVQERVIPYLMEQTGDLIVQAHTGSGKTGAFGIPTVSRVDPDRATTQALILAPTRELARQVATEVATMGSHRGVRCLPVYGGVGYSEQIEGLKRGAHVVVGTPGRILDHLGTGRLTLDSAQILILDEADEMLSLGFWPDMREIRNYLPKSRQSCLFSATIPEKVLALSRAFLNDPQFVSLVEGHSSPQEIEHFYYVTTAQEKDENLRRILEVEDPDSAIVFCNTKDDVRFVTASLQRHGFDAEQISGDLAQTAREKAMARIKAGELHILVATDVAARGIDISDLTHVVNYSSPETPEVYLHRTGRTGRAGKAGVAISLVSGLDIGNFRQLQQVNKITVQARELPKAEDLLERLRERLSVKVEREIRKLTETNRRIFIDRLVPLVKQLSKDEEGSRELAAICASYLGGHSLETSIQEEPLRNKPREDSRKATRREGRRRRK